MSHPEHGPLTEILDAEAQLRRLDAEPTGHSVIVDYERRMLRAALRELASLRAVVEAARAFLEDERDSTFNRTTFHVLASSLAALERKP